MAERRPIVLINGQFVELPAGDTLSAGCLIPIFDFCEDVTTAGTSYEDLYDYLLRPGRLVNDKDKISIEYGGSFAANGNSKSLRFTVFGTSVLTKTFTDNGVDWEMECTIMRESASVIRVHGSISVDGVTCKVAYTRITGLDLDGTDYNITLRGRTQDAAGDLTAKIGYGIFIPAAPIFYLTSETDDSLTSETSDPLTAES